MCIQIFSFSENITYFNFSLKMATKRSNRDREDNEEHGDKRVRVVAPHETVESI
jgi:hypothetical protein